MSKPLRLAIINHEKCKPKKCNKECKKRCPPQMMGKICIEIEDTAIIHESICIGCGQCEKMCPFNAIQIVNLPSELPEHIIHRYGENGFRLYKMPMLQSNTVFGILGPNGIGKSTIVKILSGDILPNFEKLNDTSTKDIIKFFRGHEMQKYFSDLYNNNLKISVKQQNIENIVDMYKQQNYDPTVQELLDSIITIKNEHYTNTLNLLNINDAVLNTKYCSLSGGEQQKLQCIITAFQNANIYIFDEPTNYLDVKQRLNVANLIRSLCDYNKYVLVVDHDITILDYISDNICIMYGKVGAFGVSSPPHSTNHAINMYFDGYLQSKNMRIRNESLSLSKHINVSYDIDTPINNVNTIPYEGSIIEYPNFNLNICPGNFPSKASITIIVGENGTGKTTFLKTLSKQLNFTISHKPQYPNLSKINKNMTVEKFLYTYFKNSMANAMFKSDVLHPLNIKNIYDKNIDELSGGELQKLSIISCLGANSQVYLLDEPFASLDIDQRMNVITALKRFIVHNNKICFIVEHDITMSLFLSKETNSNIIVCSQKHITDNVKYCETSQPMSIINGMNNFLQILNVTFRKSGDNTRYKINKKGSTKDTEQKNSHKYFDS